MNKGDSLISIPFAESALSTQYNHFLRFMDRVDRKLMKQDSRSTLRCSFWAAGCNTVCSDDDAVRVVPRRAVIEPAVSES
jgi:hypothetical protein